MPYSKRITKSERQAIKVNRKALKSLTADPNVLKALNLAKRASSVNVKIEA